MAGLNEELQDAFNQQPGGNGGWKDPTLGADKIDYERATPPDPRTLRLSKTEQLFCEHYVANGGNGRRAVIDAGYSKNIVSADQTAWMLKKKPKIQKHIDFLWAQRLRRFRVDEDKIREQLAYIAYADILDLVDEFEDGDVFYKELKDIPPYIRPAIKKIKPTRYGVEVEFHDKVTALQLLGQHIGFFKKDNEQKQPLAPQIYLPDNGRDVKQDEGNSRAEG